MDMMPPMRHGFMPDLFALELVYFGIVLTICFMIYFRTREMYSLTKHKGIKYFRHAFMYFGLAFAVRFAHQIFRLAWEALDMGRPFGPKNLLFVVFGFLSTMAILSLMMSTSWKSYKKPEILAPIIAIVATIAVFFTRSPQLLVLIQSIMMFFTVLFIAQKNRKKTALPVIYLLLFAFWVVNTLISGPWFWFTMELRAPAYLIGTAIFITLYHKVSKWAA